MGEKPNQSSNDPEARTAPMISCVPRAAETRGGEDHQRERDHQREAGLLGQEDYVWEPGGALGVIFTCRWPCSAESIPKLIKTRLLNTYFP